ncbi:MAG: FecR domain-containing protein [Acidobacteriaceae bacterium]|nr:FecR domain-containing protein [Acidobacteriaceae bacterium]
MRTFSYTMCIALLTAAALHGQNTDYTAMRPYEAHATAVMGQVTRSRDEQPWVLNSGERVPIRQVITTGADGYAHFEVAGGSSFELFGNSRVIFRQNAASPEDLLDVLGGRVRIHLQPTIGQLQLRVFCPVAIITAHQPATIALAVDEDETARIDVLEGQVGVQHRLLPRNEPVLVKAIDAVLVQKDQPISHRVERGSLYRYTVKILSTLTFGHSATHSSEPIEEGKFLAQSYGWHLRQAF